MRNILFANTTEPACGVHQFGVNFFNNLSSRQFSYFYDQPTCINDVSNFIYEENIQAIIVNWHPDIGGWPTEVLKLKAKHKDVKFLLMYHDGEPDSFKWDGFIFSDPTMQEKLGWYVVPRPIPKILVTPQTYHQPIRIGCHGFYGASANMVVEQVTKEFASAEIHLYVPIANFGDKNGQLLLDVLKLCSSITDKYPDIKVIPDFRFHSMDTLVRLLSENDINCYFRPVEPEWRGVSSALDAAVASGRPLAINKCKGFRHLHNLTPSICIEDNSIMDIMINGLESLRPYIEENTPEKLSAKMDEVMRKVIG